MPCACPSLGIRVVVLAFLVMSQVVQAYLLSTFFNTCNNNLQAQRLPFLNPARGNPAGNPLFTIYNLADRRYCLGRTTHPYVTSHSALAWVNCSTSATVSLRFSSASPTYGFGQYMGCFLNDAASDPLMVAFSGFIGSSSQLFTRCEQLAQAYGFQVFSMTLSGSVGTCYGGTDMGYAMRYGSASSCIVNNGYTMSSSTAWALYYSGVGSSSSLYPPPLARQSVSCDGSLPLGGNNFWTINSVGPGLAGAGWFRLEIPATNEIIVAAAYRRVKYVYSFPEQEFTYSYGAPLDRQGLLTPTLNRYVDPAYTYVLNIVTPAQVSSAKYSQDICCLGLPCLSTEIGDLFAANVAVTLSISGMVSSPTDVVIDYQVNPSDVYFSQLVRITSDFRLVFAITPDPGTYNPSYTFTDPTNALSATVTVSYGCYEGDYSAICYSDFPAVITSRTTTFDVNKPNYNMFEFGAIANPDGSMSTFTYPYLSSNYVPVSLAQAQASTTPTHYRFVGDYKCGCGYNDTANYDGTCLDANLCPSGKNVSTCGPLSTCIPFMGTTPGYNCLCDLGYAYDPRLGRTIRTQQDVDASNQEINSCHAVSFSVQLRNDGIELSLDTVVNSSVIFGLTHRQSNPALYGSPLQDNLVVPGGGVVTFYPIRDPDDATYYNGREFYLLVQSDFDNSTIINGTFTLPCGCDISFVDWKPTSPRPDDGRPTAQIISQRRGEIFASWTDNSICATQFSMDRIVPPSGFLATISPDVLQNPVDFGDYIQTMVKTQTLVATSVVSDYFMESSTCGRTYTPLVAFDDISTVGLDPGKNVIYCMAASNPSLEGYLSGYSCATSVLEAKLTLKPGETGYPATASSGGSSFCSFIYWEATFQVGVVVGRNSVDRPESNVTLTWQVALDSDPTQVLVSRLPQFATTAADGQAQIRFQACGDDYPFLTSSPPPPLRFHIYPAEQDVYVDETNTTVTLDHIFLCNEPARPCVDDDPLELVVQHDERNFIHPSIRDVTFVTVSGTVRVNDTADADAGFPLGCPIRDVQVCSYSAPGPVIDSNSIKFDCANTAVDGTYSLNVPMKSSAVFIVDYHGHTFVDVNQGAALKVTIVAVNDFDFFDVNIDTLYVDVYAGLCKFPIVQNIQLQLSKVSDGCGASSWTKNVFPVQVPPDTASPTPVPTSSPVSGPTVGTNTGAPSKGPTHRPTSTKPTLSPTFRPTVTRAPTKATSAPTFYINQRFAVQVPATFFEVSISAAYRTSSQVDVGLTTFFNSQSFTGDNLPTVNLTDPDNSQSDMTDSGMEARRLAVFQYDVEPTLDLAFFQEGARVDYSNNCPQSSLTDPSGFTTITMTRVLNADIGNLTANPITAQIMASQNFFGRNCYNVQGSVLIQDNLWGLINDGNNCFPDCNIALAFDPTTNLTVANHDTRPIPERTTPHWNTFVVQFTGNEGASRTILQFNVITLGQSVDPSVSPIPTYTDPILVTVVRDPPGDMSKGYYNDMESTIAFQSQDYVVYAGAVDDLKTGLQISFKADACIGLAVMACALLGEGDFDLGFMHKAEVESVRGPSTHGKRTLTRTYRWSMETSGAYLFPKGSGSEPMPGPESDMFLVTTELLLFIPIIVVTESVLAPCTGSSHTTQAFLDGTEFKRLVGDPTMSTATTGWFSRYDIETNIIPSLNATEQTPWVALLNQSAVPADGQEGEDDEETLGQLLGTLGGFDDTSPFDYHSLGAVGDIIDLGGGTDSRQDASLKLAERRLAVPGGRAAWYGTKAAYAERQKITTTAKGLAAWAVRTIQKSAQVLIQRNVLTAAQNTLVEIEMKLDSVGNKLELVNQKVAAQTAVTAAETALEKEVKTAAAPIVGRLARLSGALKVGASKLLGTFGKIAASKNIILAIISEAIAITFISLSDDQALDVDQNTLDGDSSWQFALSDIDVRLVDYILTYQGNVPRFKPLPNTLSLWNPRKRAEVLPDQVSSLVAFSGGGGTLQFDVADLDDAETTVYTNGLSSETLIGLFTDQQTKPGVTTKGGISYRVRTKWDQDIRQGKKKQSGAGFILGDSTAGDQFTVKVFRDAEFGTFAFATIAGRSKCPVENGTFPREDPELQAVTPPPQINHPKVAASFKLKLVNNAVYDSASYRLHVRFVDLKDDVQIFVDGLRMDQSRLFEDLAPLTSYEVLVQVYRGSEQYQYLLEFDLRSECEATRKGVFSQSIVFASECPAVALGGALVNPANYLADSPNYEILLTARNLDVAAQMWKTLPQVTNVKFQFLRLQGDTWDLNAETVMNGTKALDLIGSEDPVFHLSSFLWDFTYLLMYDNVLRIRAVVQCNPGNFVSQSVFPDLFLSVSDEADVRIDRIRPAVYTASPANPYPGQDEMVIEMTEDVRCGPPVPFSATLTVPNLYPAGTIFDIPSGNLLVRCDGNKLSASIASSFAKYKLLGLSATLTISNVKDIAGNLATSNQATNPTLGTVESVFTFAPLDTSVQVFRVKGFIVSNVDNTKATIQTDILTRVSTLTGIPVANLLLERYSCTSTTVCPSDVLLLPTLAQNYVLPKVGSVPVQKATYVSMIQVYTGLINVAFSVISGGGIDAVPPNMLAVLKSDLDSANVEANQCQSQITSLQSQMTAMSSQVNTILTKLSSPTPPPTTKPPTKAPVKKGRLLSSDDQDQDDSTTNLSGDSRDLSSSTSNWNPLWGALSALVLLSAGFMLGRLNPVTSSSSTSGRPVFV